MTLLTELKPLSDVALPGHAAHLVTIFFNDLNQSPLSCAIAMKLDGLAQEMIDKLTTKDVPDLLSCVDLGKWTALHHAAIRPEVTFYKQLKKLIGNRSYKENYALSPSFLRKIVGCSKKAFSFRFHIYDQQGRLQTLSEVETLQSFTFRTPPKHYSYFPTGSPEIMKAMWEHMAQKNQANDPYTINFKEDLSAYHAFVQKTVQTGLIEEVALKTITHNDLGLPVAIRGGGIVALKDIQTGVIFMEYGGAYIRNIPGNSSLYAFETVEETFYVDALTHRSPGAMMNHGWPNAKVLRITLPGRLALAVQALFPIKAGEEIRITYGSDCGNFFDEAVDLAPRATDDFLATHPLCQLSNALSVEDPSPLDYQICFGWTFLLRDSGVYCLKKFLEGKIAVKDMEVLPKILLKMGTFKMHPLESGRWRRLLTPFLDQVPLSVLSQAIHLMQTTPEQGPAKALQLKGHVLPANFQFV